MTQIRNLLVVLVLLNVTVLVTFHLIGKNDFKSQDFLTEKPNKIVLHENRLAFLANPFASLDAYPKIDPSYFNRGDFSKELYDQVIYGLKHDDDYCKKVDMYNLDHPEEMLTNRYFFTDYSYSSVPRVAIKKAGNILMNQVSNYMSKKIASQPQFDFDTKINNYYTITGGFHEYHEIGKHFLCVTQMYNHIPGNGVMFRKDLILDRLSAYREKYRQKPECFDQKMFFLPYYRLFNKEECQSFFNLVNSKDYKKSLKQEPIQYLIKQGHDAHKSQGVFLLDEEKTENLISTYDNGLKCGEILESLIAQKYISNPFLLDKNNKFDFRIYMLIASTNPLIIYYHDGYLRVSVNSFDMNSKDRATHLTNTYLAEKKFAEARKENKTINGMSVKELKDYHLWDFDRFGNYLLESGKITDLSWLDTYLRPMFQKAFTHLIKMSGDGFWKQSNVYELHGLDFMLDADMKLWFIESNPNPLLSGVKPKLISQMLTDLFDIQFAYYRSRMKRLVDVIHRMQQEATEKNELDLEKWKAEYQWAMKNRLEPEFPIEEGNTFVLVMDESRPKKEAYFGHIPSECVDD